MGVGLGLPHRESPAQIGRVGNYAIDSLQATVKSLLTKLELQEKVRIRNQRRSDRKKKEDNKVFHSPPFYTWIPHGTESGC